MAAGRRCEAMKADKSVRWARLPAKLEGQRRQGRHDPAGAAGPPARASPPSRRRSWSTRTRRRSWSSTCRTISAPRAAASTPAASTSAPNRAPIEPLKRMVARFRLEDVPVIWVNWGVRKDLLNIAPRCAAPITRPAPGPTSARPIPGTRSEILAARELGRRGGRRAQRQRRRHPGHQAPLQRASGTPTSTRSCATSASRRCSSAASISTSA